LLLLARTLLEELYLAKPNMGLVLGLTATKILAFLRENAVLTAPLPYHIFHGFHRLA
jgi:hypothetical protein